MRFEKFRNRFSNNIAVVDSQVMTSGLRDYIPPSLMINLVFLLWQACLRHWCSREISIWPLLQLESGNVVASDDTVAPWMRRGDFVRSYSSWKRLNGGRQRPKLWCSQAVLKVQSAKWERLTQIFAEERYHGSNSNNDDKFPLFIWSRRCQHNCKEGFLR